MNEFSSLPFLSLGSLFFAFLGLGLAMVLPMFPIKEVGKSFVRYSYGFIVFGLLLFFLCLNSLGQLNFNYIGIALMAVWIWILSFRKESTKIEDGLIRLFALFAAILLGIHIEKNILSGMELSALLPRLGIFFTSAIFLATQIQTMVFGHWYLVNRNLPILYLIRATRRQLLITYLRIFTVGFAIFYAQQNLNPEEFNRLTDILGHGMFFWARIIAGLGIPLTAAHLAHASAKIGSNQSATGILYAGTISALMGEIMGLYLYYATHIPF